ncbi:MAG: putative methyltransferase [Pseudohongiellaceae bacterium]|jgi:predicted methyltransferase
MNKITMITIAALTMITLQCSLVRAQKLDQAALLQAISGPDREVSDFIRDPVRKPAQVLDFLGVTPGMTVLDLYAAGGYYTFIFSKAVGPQGTVYAQNTVRGRQFVEDRQDITQGQALDQKIEQGKLSNVVQIVRPLASLGLQPGSLDAVMVAQVLHDYYNPNPDRALNMLLQIKALLKPGGIIGITDHVGISRYDNNDLHRMTIAQATAVAEEAGFEVFESNLLRVPSDNHSRSIFDPRLNRTTDRFLLKLRKPELPE